MNDRESLATVVDQVQIGMAQIGEALRPMLEAVGDACRKAWEAIYPELRRSYEEAGSPYGPDDEGMMRWWKEQAAVIQALQQAQEQAAWNESMRKLGICVREHDVYVDGCPYCRTQRFNGRK